MQKADAILSGARSYQRDDAEVCQYALYRRISRAVGLIALTLLGGLITDFGSAFCFTVSFLFLRERTGGYHAKTEWQAHYTLPP